MQLLGDIIIIMEFRELSEEEFERARFGCDNFLQSVEMYRRHKALGREAYLVGVRDEKTQAVVAKGVIMTHKWYLGKKLCRVPGGWVLDYEVKNWQEVLGFLTEQAKEFCVQRGGIVIEIAPNVVAQARDGENNIVRGGEDHLAAKAELVKLGYKYLGEYECTKWTYALDLKDKEAEEIFRSFREGHRRVMKKGIKSGVKIRELSNGELGILDGIIADTAKRRGFHDSGMDYYRTMKEHFGDKVWHMVAEAPRYVLAGKAEPEDEDDKKMVPIAAAMFVGSGEEVTYLCGGSRVEYKKLGAPHLIQWEMIQRAKEAGYMRHNFYGMKPVKGSGVYMFKQGFHGYVREMLGMFALPIGILGKIYVARLKEITYACIKGEEGN